MIGERTIDGWEIRLRARGPGRFLGAAFLAFWLCGWAAGESFALWILIKGGIALLTRMPPEPGRELLQVAPAAMVGAFLILWLGLWTLGGIGALYELQRLLWGEDRLTVYGAELKVVQSRGLFRSVRRYPREVIRRFSLVREGRLVLETDRERVELSALGSSAERAEAAAALTAELGVREPAIAGAATLPDAWEETITPEGERALIANASKRRTQARVAGVIALLLAGLTFVIAREAVDHRSLLVPALIVFAFTVGAAAGAQWLALGRSEWRIGSGRLTLRRRYGSSVRDVFEARRLLLDSASDSDGDTWYELIALGEGEPSPAPVSWRPGRPKNSRTVAKLMNEDHVVRNLGAWLAHNAGLELEDRTTPSARKFQLAQLRNMLEGSGRFGRWAAKVVDKMIEGRRDLE